MVRPALPPPASWTPYLDESYREEWYSNFGPVSARLERALAAEFGHDGEEFVLASSATSGLAACLIAERIAGPVLVPAFTFPATASAVRMAGAEPVLIDVDAARWACDAAALGRALDKIGARAVMLVAPFGIAQDFSAHLALCAARGAVAIIDNAAGLGGPRRACRGAVYEVFSLHATKPFAIGEGGAVAMPETRVENFRAALNFGLPSVPTAEARWGINGKMSDFAAAIGLAVLDTYRDIVAARRQQARRYLGLLGQFADIAVHRGVGDAPWQVFPCLMPTPDAAAAFVAAAQPRGLELRRYYRPSLAEGGFMACAEDCAVSAMLAERMVCLPVYSRISEAELAELHRIVAACLERSLAVPA